MTSPLDEDLALAVSGRDAEVGLACLTGTVDDAAHHRDAQRHVEPLESGGDLVGERVDVDLRASARRARHDLESARAQVQRLEDLVADLDLLDRRRGQRHPDGVADALRASKAPNATADLMVPWNAGPASVTPRCSG